MFQITQIYSYYYSSIFIYCYLFEVNYEFTQNIINSDCRKTL